MKIASISCVARRLLLVCAVAAAVFESPSTQAANNIGVFFDLRFLKDQASPGANPYVAFPDLNSAPGGQTNATHISSPNGKFTGTLNPGNSGSSSASSFSISDFTTYMTELNSSGWTLTLDSNTPTPTPYTFSVDASAITDFGIPPAHISSGLQGATLPSGSTNFSWSGPSDFDDIQLVVDNLTTASEHSYVRPETDTSFTPPDPLTAGNYDVTLLYIKNISDKITTTTPMNAQNQLLTNWDGVTGAQEIVSDNVTFTVTPEPTSSAMLAIGGLIALRRRRHQVIGKM